MDKQLAQIKKQETKYLRLKITTKLLNHSRTNLTIGFLTVRYSSPSNELEGGEMLMLKEDEWIHVLLARFHFEANLRLFFIRSEPWNSDSISKPVIAFQIQYQFSVP